MAGAVKLSIYSTFDDKGTKKGERAIEAFTKKYGTIEKTAHGAKYALSDTTAELLDQSIKADFAAQKWAGYSDKLSTVGATATRYATLPIMAVGAASVAAAVNIDSSLTSVKKTVDGTEQQYQQLKQAAIDFSETNAVSASQILDIQALGAQLGFAIEELDEFSQVVSGLDIATNMDAETAGTELARFANITKMSHDEISNYGSAIVGLGNNFATTESEVSAMAMRIAASGTQVGMSQADILGVAAALSSLGVEAEAGGTAVSTIMSNIDKAVATGSDQMLVWADTAKMSASDFAAAWQNDPVQALSAVLSGMEGATTEGSNMSLMLDDLGISSLRQTDVMKRLAGNSELMADAVSKSNEEWTANTALTKEVENRNESLEAKFQMLQNKAIAVGESVGGPVADALLDAADAAMPLVEGIGDAAKAFSDMDEGTQRVIIGAAGAVAAFGPLASVGSKVAGAVSIAHTAYGKFNANVAKYSATTGAATVSTNASTVALKAQYLAAQAGTTAIKALSTAAKGIGIGLLVSAAATVIGKVTEINDHISESNRLSSELRSSNSSMVSSLDLLGQGFSGADSAISDYVGSADQLKATHDEITQSHNDLAKSLTDTMSEAGASAGALDRYKDTINELGTKSELTEGEQVRLRDAVSRVNEACGTSFQVTSDQNGALYGQVDAINAVVGAKKEQLKYEAASQGLSDLYKQQADNEAKILETRTKLYALSDKMEGKNKNEISQETLDQYNELNSTLVDLTQNQNGVNDSVATYEKYLENLGGVLGSTKDEIAAFIAGNETLSAALGDAGVDVDKLSEALSQAGVSTSDLSTLTSEELSAMLSSYDGDINALIGLLQSYGIEIGDEQSKTAQAAQEMAKAISGMGDDVTKSLEGIDIGVFTQKLADAGIRTEVLNEIGSENLAALAENCNGNIDAMVFYLQHYNDTPILDKDGNVQVNEASLLDAQGNVYTWNGSDLLDKDGNALLDDVELTDAQANLWTWNGSALVPKGTTATVDDGKVRGAIGTRREWNDGELFPKETSATINIFRNITDFFTGGSANAAGGIRLNAAGGIRKHAAGAIVHKAVPLDIVGEDGAEAIVPLTNKRYSEPFAETISEQMLKHANPTATGISVDDIAQAMVRALSGMAIVVDGNKFVKATGERMGVELGRIQEVRMR